jgi:ketosteroid isomerase-like protein
MSETNPSDERSILNALGTFARVLDQKQWARIGEVFADDVVFDYGEGSDRQGIEVLRAHFAGFLDRCGPTQHLLGSIQIELHGDDALSRSYVQARHQGKGEQGQRYVDTNGEYVDRWQRRNGAWRIVRRDARWSVLMGDTSVLFG